NQTNWRQVLLQKTQSIAEDDTCEEKIETTLVTESELQPHGTNEHAISTLKNVERSDAAVVSQSSEEHKDIVQEEVQEPVLLPESEEELAKEQQKLNQQEYVMRLVQNSPKDLEDNTNKINISVWDFAGQYAFYNTHQVFLTRRAIYLIVTNMSKDLTDEVNDTCFEDSTGGRKLKVLDFARFWLNSIHEFCQTGKEGEPPVLLVGTFADEYSKRQNIDETNYQLRKNDLEETYFDPLRTALGDGAAENHILKHFMIDNNCTVDKTSSQFEELKKEILKISKKQSYVGDLIPTKFLLLEEALNKKRKEGKKILNKEVDFSKCNEESLFKLDEKEVDVFLRFYHEVGSIIYFNENTLKDYVLLEPQWLIDAFKKLITAEQFMRNTDQKKFIRWKKFAKTAILEKDLIDMCWKDMVMSDRTLLLEYMEKLGLIVKDRKVNRIFVFST
ncbi:probable serine/threonine-protein kinase roco6, partial [Mercenaria mercenaria]|uniref:probable serine/threonine-protein kinase roco6 n=1 Tax=Mercenaria mercenaria TaxID=6596 RepID=UPI00234F2357